jgi:hypothetical protein
MKLKRDDSKKVINESSDSSSPSVSIPGEDAKKSQEAVSPKEEEVIEYSRELKDAFKVFRKICILGIKPFQPQKERLICVLSLFDQNCWHCIL